MIIKEKGEAAPGFHLLGRAHTPVYLIDAERPVLIDGGMAHLANLYIADAKAVLGDRCPAYLLHTHVHFDHCGSSAKLKEAFPAMRLAASPEGAAIMERPGARELIRTLSDQAREDDPNPPSPDTPRFEPFSIETVFSHGDEIPLGGGEVLQVFKTPGHTRDFLSFYHPGKKILIASESAGCAQSLGDILVEFVADYDAYLASLEFLSTLDADYLCQGHLFVYTHSDARKFLKDSLAATVRYRELVEKFLAEEGGDLARVVQRVKKEEWDPLPWPKQPEPAYLLNTEGRVRNLAARLQRARQGSG